MSNTFWKYSERFSPILCRLLARHSHGKPLTCWEIASKLGDKLTPHQVAQISQQTDWGSIDLVTMRRFLTGCGMDFCNRQQMKRVDAYMRSRPTFKYLKTSPDWKPLYEPMLRKWRESLTKG